MIYSDPKESSPFRSCEKPDLRNLPDARLGKSRWKKDVQRKELRMTGPCGKTDVDSDRFSH